MLKMQAACAGPTFNHQISTGGREMSNKMALTNVHATRCRHVQWYIMTSPATDAATRQFFEEQKFFGLDPGQVAFFQQVSTSCCMLSSTHPLNPCCWHAGHRCSAALLSRRDRRDLVSKHARRADSALMRFPMRVQGTLPCLTPEGKVIMASHHRMATAPDGNGGVFAALQRWPPTPLAPHWQPLSACGCCAGLAGMTGILPASATPGCRRPL